jgi:transcription initiation factor TFIIIB Brf1 subunit/transcription initiation factor TFIIB
MTERDLRRIIREEARRIDENKAMRARDALGDSAAEAAYEASKGGMNVSRAVGRHIAQVANDAILAVRDKTGVPVTSDDVIEYMRMAR